MEYYVQQNVNVNIISVIFKEIGSSAKFACEYNFYNIINRIFHGTFS